MPDGQEESVDLREEAKAIIDSEAVEDFLVVGRVADTIPVTLASLGDQEELETAETEIQLVALFLAHLADRTGRDREDLLEELVENLNEIPPRWVGGEGRA